MKAKSFLKKMNRGVALAAALLIGLMVFFVVDAVTFSKEETALKEFLEEYLEECAKVNLLPEQYREPGAEIPGDVLDAKAQEYRDFIEKYFTEYMQGNKNYRYSAKGNVLRDMEYIFNSRGEDKLLDYTVKELEYSLVGISSVKKQATNAATVNFKVSMRIVSPTNGRFLNLTQFEWDVRRYTNDYYSSPDIEEQNKLQEISSDHDCAVTLFKVNGKWKIADGWVGYNYGGGMVREIRIG